MPIASPLATTLPSLLRVPSEKTANILPHDNSKINHGVFAIPIKPTIQNHEWSVFHLDDVVDISLDKSK